MKDYFIYSGADRLKNVEMSSIRIVIEKARDMAAAGYPVISLSAGEPDFNTPKAIKEATIDALREDMTHYSSNRGYLPLKKEIAASIKEETGTEYDPDKEILTTNGGAEALNNIFLSTINPRDEVIIFTPAFVSYRQLAIMCGATPVEIPLTKENGYQIDIEAVKAAITDRTKMIVLNNPNNPTGAVYKYEKLEQLCKIAIENNLMVLSDEIYSNIVYDGEFHSIASFPGMKERTFLVSGFSKIFAMTGWRMGYIACDSRFYANLMKVHQYSTTSSVTFTQAGLARAMRSESVKEDTAQMVKTFAKRRNLITALLDEIPGLSYVVPEGAFYIMIDVSATGLNGEEFAKRLLNEKYVATVPAVGLGSHCVNEIRVSFASSEESLIEAFSRMKDFVKEILK